MNSTESDLRVKLGSFFEPIFTLGPDGIYIFKMFIGGKWVSLDSGKTLDVISPINNKILSSTSLDCPSNLNE